MRDNGVPLWVDGILLWCIFGVLISCEGFQNRDLKNKMSEMEVKINQSPEMSGEYGVAAFYFRKILPLEKLKKEVDADFLVNKDYLSVNLNFVGMIDFGEIKIKKRNNMTTIILPQPKIVRTLSQIDENYLPAANPHLYPIGLNRVEVEATQSILSDSRTLQMMLEKIKDNTRYQLELFGFAGDDVCVEYTDKLDINTLFFDSK